MVSYAIMFLYVIINSIHVDTVVKSINQTNRILQENNSSIKRLVASLERSSHGGYYHEPIQPTTSYITSDKKFIDSILGMSTSACSTDYEGSYSVTSGPILPSYTSLPPLPNSTIFQTILASTLEVRVILKKYGYPGLLAKINIKRIVILIQKV